MEIASRYGDPFFHLKRQSVFGAGLYCDADNLHLPMNCGAVSVPVCCCFLSLADAGFNSGVGKSSMAVLDGLIGLLQSSAAEVAKVFIVIYVAAYLERHADEVRVAFVGL